MSKPIIDAQGAYVTEPKGLEVFAIHANDIGWHKFTYKAYKGDSPEGAFIIHNLLYATQEAAEMAIIRAKCIRRLKEMAYGDGWLPNWESDKEIHHIPILHHFGQLCPPTIMQAGGIALPVFFKDRKAAFDAYETITIEEQAAFLYVYQPEEDK